MYIPGRLRTASRPSRIVMSFAPYSSVVFATLWASPYRYYAGVLITRSTGTNCGFDDRTASVTARRSYQRHACFPGITSGKSWCGVAPTQQGQPACSGRTRTSIASIASRPNSARSRSMRSCSRNRNCVAHAGSDTATTSVVPFIATGRLCAATASPTSSGHRPKTRVVTSAEGPPR